MQQRLQQAAQARLITENNALQRTASELVHICQIRLLQEQLHLTHLTDEFAKRPERIIFGRHCELDTLNDKLKNECLVNLDKRNQEVETQALMLRLLSPENILRKGFVILKRNPTDTNTAINIGEEVQIITAEEELTATITNKKEHDRR